MKKAFINKNFGVVSRKIIYTANDIIDEYLKMGLRLTLRQLYYQFVSRDLIANKQSEYKRLGSIINDGRLCGLIDWDVIEDRTRNSRDFDGQFDSPEEIIHAACSSYRIPFWKEQPVHCEVWVEKEALAGVIETIASRWRVTSFACKGYTSQSEMYAAGMRIQQALSDNKTVTILHLGDHDPSGIDMSRDIKERLTMFGYPRNCTCSLDDIKSGNACRYCMEWNNNVEYNNTGITIKRIALNMDQIKKYNPPPNPAKTTDGRFNSYAQKFGNQSWELDALNPQFLQDLIGSEIKKIIDASAWNYAIDRENIEKAEIAKIADNYVEVVNFAKEI